MHHYMEALTNTRGDALIGYFAKVVDPDTGLAVPLYADSSETPIISVSGVADTCKTDASGMIDFYVEVGTYHLDLYATDGTSFVKRLENVPMNVDEDTAAQAEAAKDDAEDAAANALAYRDGAETFAEEAAGYRDEAALAVSGLAAAEASILAALASSGSVTLEELTTSGLPLNVKWFGAVGDGVADDTAAIQSAINLAAATGGPKVVYFPTPAEDEFYRCDSPLDLSETDGVKLFGEGGRVEPTQDRVSCSLVYTGTAPVFIIAGKSRGLTLEGLAIQVSNAGFTGDIISTDHDGSIRVTYSTAIINCLVGGRTTAARFARSCVNLQGAVEAFIDLSVFGYADHQVISYTSDGSRPYSNAVTLTRNRFIEYNNHAINIYTATQWSIKNNVFEYKYGTSLSGGEAAGISDDLIGGVGRDSDAIVIADNGFWDTDTGTWIDVYGSGMTISGNYVDVNDGATFVHFHGGIGASLSGNRISGTTGGVFMTVSEAPISGLVDDGSNVVSAGVTYNANTASTNLIDRSFQDVSVRLGRATSVSGTGGYYHARSTVGANVVGGAIVLDRNDSTNWRGGAIFSFYDGGSSKDTLAFAISADTTSPLTTSKIRMLLTEDGDLRVHSLGFRPSVSVGGTVTQATSKSTGVTLNKATGQITMHNASLAAGAKVSFVVTNSTVAATDVIIPSIASGGTANAYRAAITAVAAGSFTITVENITGGSLGEAPVINFAVIKGVTS